MTTTPLGGPSPSRRGVVAQSQRALAMNASRSPSPISVHSANMTWLTRRAPPDRHTRVGRGDDVLHREVEVHGRARQMLPVERDLTPAGLGESTHHARVRWSQ